MFVQMMLSVRRSLLSVLAATAVIAGGVVVSADNPGDGILDPSFGDGGIVSENLETIFPSTRTEIEAQPDGKILIAGTVDSAEGAWTTVVERHLPDGELDPTFGTAGRVTIDLMPDQYEYIYDMVLDGSGDIFVLAGYGYDHVVLGLDPSGRPLAGLGTGGIIRHPRADSAQLGSLAVATDGSIVIGGRTEAGTGSAPPYYSMAIWRYTATGVLDTGFGTAGTSRLDLTGSSEVVDIATLGDGSIVGLGRVFSGSRWSTVLLRMTASGTLDTSFDTDGHAEPDLSGSSFGDDPAAMHLLAGGEMLVAVSLENVAGGTDLAVAKFTPAGVLDTSFDNDGITTHGGSTTEHSASALDVLADGTVIVAGRSGEYIGVDSAAALVAFAANGAPLNAFGANAGNAGVPTAVTSDTSSYVDVAVSGSGQSERITAVGVMADIVGFSAFVQGFAARFTPDGAVDTGFDTDGVIDDPMSAGMGALEYTVHAAELADDRILAVEIMSGALSMGSALTMYLPDGTVDTTWGSDGSVVDAQGVTYVTGALIDGEGRVLVTGVGIQGDLQIRRYLPDGTVDSDFGTAGVADRPAQFGTIDFETAPAVIIDDAGRILVGTGLVVGSSTDVFVYRLTESGRLDTSFGSSGSMTIDIDRFDSATALAVDPSGRILVVGYSIDGTPAISYVMARLSDDGVLDPTFGSSGMIVGTLPGGDGSWANSIVLDPEGRLIVGFLREDQQGYSHVVLRFLGDGTVDPTFTPIEMPTAIEEGLFPMVLLRDDGRLLVVVYEEDAGDDIPTRSVLRSFGADGEEDTSFGIDGALELDGIAARSVVAVSSGDILLSGITIGFDIDYDRTLVRVLGELMIVPAAPAAPTLAAADGALTVTWTAPIDDGAPRPTGYLVTLSPGGATCSTTGAVTCEITGLTNGTAYTAVVRAANRIGPGPDSPASAAATPTAPATTVPATTVPATTVPATTVPTTTVPMELPATGGSGGSGVGVLALAVGALAALFGRRQAAR